MIDIDPRKCLKFRQGDRRVHRQQPAIARDNQGTWKRSRRPFERGSVSRFAPKIQATEKREDFAYRRLFSALHSARELEARVSIENQLCAFPSRSCGRQEKNPLHAKI